MELKHSSSCPGKPGYHLLLEKTHEPEGDVAPRGQHRRHHRAPCGQCCARGFPGTSRPVLTAVREAGVCTAAAAAEEEAQSGHSARAALAFGCSSL